MDAAQNRLLGWYIHPERLSVIITYHSSHLKHILCVLVLVYVST
jgi:hypothetical protein